MHPQTPQSELRRDESRGFNNKQQKKIVFKTSTGSSNSENGHRNLNEPRNGLLTSSLRQNSDISRLNYKPTGAQDNKNNNSQNCSKQAWRCSGGNGSKQNKHEQGRFVKYLPHDEEGGLDPEETQGVADLLNHELSALLKMKPRDFWKVVATDDSLQEFLDSYLQFKKRWYDISHCSQTGSMAGLVVGDQELSRRVFMVLYRMSSNQDPGAPTRESFSSKEHTDLLLEKRLLDIPKLMDISAIFGHDNLDLTRSLVSNVLKSQPGLVDELKGVVPQFQHIVDMMDRRCSSSLEALPSPRDNGTSPVKQLHEDLLEVLDFINDAVVTLDAFVEAYAPAAPFFISFGASNEGNQELLPMLAYLHDSLLSVLEKGLGLTTENAKKDASNDLELALQLCLKTLRARIVKFAWQLLYTCYLSQTFSKENSHYPSSKIFPAQVEDPGVRGDIIVQIIGDIVERSSIVDGPHTSGVFLWNLDRRHQLMYKIDELCQNGWMHLDEAQYGYIYQLAGHSDPKKLREYRIDETAPEISTLALKDEVNHQEETVILESKISQIKDIFPDYGDGFLSACLDVYNDNPEEVIQHILEGTLHPDLLSLDTTQLKPNYKQSSSNKNDKGKGRMDESTYLVQEKSKLDGSNSKNTIAVSSSRELKKSSLSPDMKFSAAGRYVRRSKDDINAATILDQKDVKDSLRSAILATQYDDEYDDSFDELGMGVVDSGIEEIESLDYRIPSQRAQKWSLDSTIDEAGPSRKLNDSLDDSTWRENTANVSNKKLVPEVSHSSVKESAPSVQRTGHGYYGKGKCKEQQKRRFYVKDGKNYNYEVAGAIVVSSAEEAEALRKVEEETIHGLGPGGNVPLKQIESSAGAANDHDTTGNRATQGGGQRGRVGYGKGGVQGDKVAYVRKNNDNHHRKDQAMKKHFSGLGGY